VNKSSSQERRKHERHNLSYYLTVSDEQSQRVLGHLMDLSAQGMMIDCKEPLPTGLNLNLRLELTENIADRAFIPFVARIKWCRVDPIQPFLYNAGLEVVSIDPQDMKIFEDIAEKYSQG
jgi:hypothetical protein